MSRWFRVYDELVDDPKVQMLPDRTFRALVNLWCLASRNDGELPPIEEMAFSLRMKADKVGGILADLRAAGLIEDDDGVTRPHNWNGRQFKSDVSNERVKRHRQRQRNVTPTVTVTPPETETEAETDNTPSLRSGGARAKPRSTPATRIPDDFAPDIEVAVSLGLSRERAAVEAANFLDYWRSKSGNATKRDWLATWRVWCRKSEQSGGFLPARQQKVSAPDKLYQAASNVIQNNEPRGFRHAIPDYTNR